MDYLVEFGGDCATRLLAEVNAVENRHTGTEKNSAE